MISTLCASPNNIIFGHLYTAQLVQLEILGKSVSELLPKLNNLKIPSMWDILRVLFLFCSDNVINSPCPLMKCTQTFLQQGHRSIRQPMCSHRVPNQWSAPKNMYMPRESWMPLPFYTTCQHWEESQNHLGNNWKQSREASNNARKFQTLLSYRVCGHCAFPFRKRSMPFSRHLEIFLTVNEFFATKLKKKENLQVAT